MTATCKTCRFWQATKKHVDLGACRRKPPVLIVLSNDEAQPMFPYTDDDEWCGEYKPNTETAQSMQAPPITFVRDQALDCATFIEWHVFVWDKTVCGQQFRAAETRTYTGGDFQLPGGVCKTCWDSLGKGER